jgi:uncharacterized protein (TIGR03435 family)
MAIVTESLSSVLERSAHDATDLKGYYDFGLEWTPDVKIPGTARR